MAPPVPWKVPTLVLAAGLVCFGLSFLIGVRGPHGPNTVGFFLLLASLLLIPAGWIWFVTVLVHTRRARRQSRSAGPRS
jgi:hypothetical protein